MNETDAVILDETIEDLRGRLVLATDCDEHMKVTDRILKAIKMRSSMKSKRKGKGFDLGDHDK